MAFLPRAHTFCRSQSSGHHVNGASAFRFLGCQRSRPSPTKDRPKVQLAMFLGEGDVQRRDPRDQDRHDSESHRIAIPTVRCVLADGWDQSKRQTDRSPPKGNGIKRQSRDRRHTFRYRQAGRGPRHHRAVRRRGLLLTFCSMPGARQNASAFWSTASSKKSVRTG